MEVSTDSGEFDFSDPKIREGQRLIKGGPGDVYATTTSDARNHGCEEKERQESPDPDAPAESEQDLPSHISVVGLVLFTASVSVANHLFRLKGVGCRFVRSFRIRH